MNYKIFGRIVCFTRGVASQRAPEELLELIKTASESPLRVIKEITNPHEIKRTLKVSILPWGDLCLHEYRWDPRRVALSPFRLSRGERTWHYYEEIQRNNIIVPEPLMLVELKTVFFTTITYVTTRWIDESLKLEEIALHENMPSSCNSESILHACVDTIARLHNAGFVHGDLKWSNILVINERDPRIVLTDLDALKKSSSASLQSKDFARFLIAPANSSLSSATIDLLIERYLKNRHTSRSFLNTTIRRYLANNLSPHGKYGSCLPSQ